MVFFHVHLPSLNSTYHFVTSHLLSLSLCMTLHNWPVFTTKIIQYLQFLAVNIIATSKIDAKRESEAIHFVGSGHHQLNHELEK